MGDSRLSFSFPLPVKTGFTDAVFTGNAAFYL